jgi:hypothetical protein
MEVYRSRTNGVCPHCSIVVRFEDEKTLLIGPNSEFPLNIISVYCPNCQKPIIGIYPGYKDKQNSLVYNSYRLLWPTSTSRNTVPQQVPKFIAEDYNEAAMVLPLSPKASAALSRRCLQEILKEAGRTKEKDLSKQINEVLPKLPSYIAESIDAIRNIGNFAAHPIKDTNSGELIEVETGEAEWNLDVLDILFDFYYVQPDIVNKRKEALNEKLEMAKKPLMK